ncbi:redoxin domain-containing protein [Halobacteriovorax sp. JY17]|uniref:glutathione peroxidase n=1 Tax=Halobacteriovorax sp. JY17 TaxID=2014617 RepID=UPI000C55BCFA|nr:redoxin domain-containing protein [Halobacteriovorax sp. JY17]PIK15628.1 MAG: glutathione peroxidase [Halobacteriovorax sp. JY17]
MENLLEVNFKNKNGESVSLKDFKAKAYLIVNVASKCGLTPQYEGLQNLYTDYKEKGLEILGFPANEFLAQEPGTNEEIQSFCSLTYNVTFPVNEKIVVKGEGQHKLFHELTNSGVDYTKNEEGNFENLLTEKGLISGAAHDIKWNFEKFLVDSSGKVVARYFPDVVAGDERLKADILRLLNS